MRASRLGRHISGAEGLFLDKESLARVSREYLRRALSHPKGTPDSITITLESLSGSAKTISSLPLVTVRCSSTREAKAHIIAMLKHLRISEDVIDAALKIANDKRVMRGAALLGCLSGKRLDPDTERGVRVSRLGIGAQAGKSLSAGLARLGINRIAVTEALVLASKVAGHPAIVAELCVSDDPDYTTGYVASREFGYVRIPFIKRKGQSIGGRVFFVNENADADGIIRYLERKPVIIDKISGVFGVADVEDVIRNTNR